MNFDILRVHDKITDFFDDEDARALLFVDQRRALESLLARDLLDDHTRAHVEGELAHLSQLFQIPRANYFYYVLESAPILDAYRTALRRPIEVDFMASSPQIIMSTECGSFREDYLRVLSAQQLLEFVPVESARESGEPCVCVHCEAESVIEQDMCLFVCTECGLDQERVRSLVSFRDTERANITTKYTYARRTHFRDCINQFQGKQNCTIHPSVYERLRYKLKVQGLEGVGETPQDRYNLVQKQHISFFLKEINETKHYEDRNLIYHAITGKPLDDISHLEEQLVRDFDLLDELYEEHFVKTNRVSNRKNFIHTQYILFQLLRRYNYPCNKSDFNLLKTTQLKLFQDSICSELFALLHWNFTPIF